MRFVSTALLASILLCSGLWAQGTSGSQISGTVRDASGAAVPDATVQVTQTDTGLVRTVASGPDGRYVIPNLPVGPYKMEVSKSGFSTYVQTGFTLQVNSNPTMDVSLKVGSVAESVTVEASAAMVETHSTGVGQVVDQQRVVDLPLNGRIATDLIYLAGAAAQAPNADLVSTKNYPNQAPIAVAGGLANGTTYMLDGGTYNDPLNNLSLPLPFPDALQEFKVETSALPAQYGHHSASAVNGVTKSGTNEFHGDAFEFVRNYIFNARNFFAPTRDSLKRNQFGGTVGGPIKHDKVFFFLGYQGTIIRSNPTGAFSFEPTADMLKGDWTTIASPACNNGRQITLKAPFVNNTIDPSLFVAPALKMLNYYPAPVNACGKVNYATVQNFDEHAGLARVDYQLSSNHTIFGRYFGSHALVSPTYDGKNPLTATLSGADDMVNSFVLGDTLVIGANLINSFRGTFNRSAVTKTNPPMFTATDLGVKYTNLVPNHSVITASGALYSSVFFSYPATDPTTSYQLADDFSWMKGSHQIAFGASWIRSIQNVYGPLSGDGLFTFTGQVYGLSMADFLLGNVGTFTQGMPQYDYERYHYIGLYIQDNWKVTPRLTMNYGLRWEPYIGGSMATGYVSHFDPALFAQNAHSTVYPNAPAGELFPGDPGFDTSNRPSHVKLNDFAPRLGVVWDPKGNGRMTVRASWGLFYELPHTLFAYGFSQAPPWGEQITRNNVSFADPWAGFPGGDPFPVNLNKNFVFPVPGNYTSYPLDVKPTYLEQWNLSIQKQIGTNWLASASYMGTNTIHLWNDNPINAAVYIPGNCQAGQYGLTVAGPCSSTANTNQRRALYLQNPDQGKYYGTIHQLDETSTASYNAMLLSLQHRLASHFTVLANYTWSHCISDPFTSELDGVQYTNPANRRYDRGNCVQIDRRHLVNVSTVLETPRFAERWMQAILGDWKVSGIMRIQSGSYFTLTTGGADIALNGITNPAQHLNQVLDSTICNNGASCAPLTTTGVAWFNPKAFVNPSTGTFGNMGAANILGPGSFQFDTGFTRQFRIREKQTLEVRAEMFNIFNHYRPGNPTATSNSATFGTITTSGDPRIMQFALKYVF